MYDEENKQLNTESTMFRGVMPCSLSKFTAGVTSQMIAIFIANVMRTSNLTKLNIYPSYIAISETQLKEHWRGTESEITRNRTHGGICFWEVK